MTTPSRTQRISDMVTVYCTLEDALEVAMMSSEGVYSVRGPGGRTANFREDGGILTARVRPDMADLLWRVPGYEVEGRDPYPHQTWTPPVPCFQEEGARLRRENEGGSAAASRAEASSDNPLVNAMLQMVLEKMGPQGLAEMLRGQIAPEMASAAEKSVAQHEAEAQKAEDARAWRYRDLAGRIDPMDALELMHDYRDHGQNLGALNDEQMLAELAKKCNLYPVLEGRVKELLSLTEPDAED